ncbi:MAG: PepSY domain-containing protein [Hymenobacteraceae bacterium]|nr:PepSY domain-containing protein [Hymenobacteraceae bacterium]MDX5423127.1 PepSY domain-containing protein [Hymenobacteraceae bacterium]
MRKSILKIHLWLGLTVGAVLVVVGITGSVYVFQPELTSLLYADQYRSEKPGAKALDPRLIVKAAEEQFKAPVTTLHFPVRELQNYILKVKGKKEWVFYDAATGRYKGELEKRRGVLDTVLDIHRQLTLGEIGSKITGACALILAFILISSGLILWLPRKKRNLKDGLRLKPDASFKRRNYDIHNVFGFYLSLPLVVISVTGAYFAFPDQVQAVADYVTRTQEPTPNIKTFKSTYRADMPPMTVYQALDLMDSTFPSYYKRAVTMPADSADRVYFSYVGTNTIDAGQQYRPMVFLDQYTAEVLYAYDPLTSPAGAKLTRNWFLAVHFGEVGGTITRVLWFFLGLAPAMFWVTGIIMWRGRGKKKKKARIAPVAVR